jgi:hypothetical protein
MKTYAELVELALTAAGNAHAAMNSEVAAVLWRIAEGYQAQAGKLGDPPDIGDPPSSISSRPPISSLP